MHENELSAALALVGIRLLEVVDPMAPLLPPYLAGIATNYPRPDGGWSAVSVESADPSVIEKANAGWYELCRRGGLFGEDRRFLLGAQLDEGRWGWVRVELDEEWDVMGAGSASVLGIGYGRPGFIMMSLDGAVIVRGTVWETSIGAILTCDPRDIPKFLDFAVWTAGWPQTPDHERAAIERWMSSLEQDR